MKNVCRGTWLAILLWGDLVLATPPGALDLTFDPPAINGEITAVALQLDGKILIGGSFTTIAGEPHARLARLNSNGTLDGSFNPTLGLETSLDYRDFNLLVAGPVSAIVLDAAGKILLGGAFNQVNGRQIRGIARLNPDGALDSTFNPGVGIEGETNSTCVSSLALDPNGKIVIAGQFTKVNGARLQNIARLNTDGSADASFIPGWPLPNTTSLGRVRALAIQADGKVLLAGYFESAVRAGSYKTLLRLNSDGTLDAGLNPVLANSGPLDGYIPEISRIAVQENGNILIAGRFDGVNGTLRSRIARLRPDGALDEGFDPGSGIGEFFYPSGRVDVYPKVRTLTVLPDEKIVIGGAFNQVNGANLPRIARLHSDGRVDLNFYPGKGIEIGTAYWQYVVSALAVQSDGKILLAGSFDRVDGIPRSNIARLYGDDLNARLPAIVRQPASQSLREGTNAVFTILAEGTQLNYQWRFNGTDLLGATNETLVIRSVALTNSGEYSVTVSNSFGFVTSSNAFLRVMDIADALDDARLIWKAGAFLAIDRSVSPIDQLWFPQTEVSHDGSDALSSPVPHWQFVQSWVETSVLGPGTLTFWWKATGDFLDYSLHFFRNGAEEKLGISRSGFDWTPVRLNIPAGSQNLRWSMSSDGLHQNTVFLDQVNFMPLRLSILRPSSPRAIELTVTGTAIGERYALEVSKQLADWTVLTNFLGAADPTRVIDSESSARPQGFYRIRVAR